VPRKRQFRRLRRLRLIGTTGTLVALIGGASGVLAAGDAFHHRPGGVPGMAIGAVLVVAGLGTAIWALPRYDRVEADDRQRLKALGLDDGLPMGAFRDHQDIGLEPADYLLMGASVFAGVAVVLAATSLTETPVGWQYGLGFALLVGIVPASVCMRLGTGTRLWLTPEGIERRRWPMRSVRWADVTRLVPLYRGIPEPRISVATDAIELQTAAPSGGWLNSWGGRPFTIRVLPLELSATELVPLLEANLPLPPVVPDEKESRA
jgi:hypothetical protein